jgi:hypothetical protein
MRKDPQLLENETRKINGLYVNVRASRIFGDEALPPLPFTVGRGRRSRREVRG